MAEVRPSSSVVITNVNGLNSIIKRQTLAEQIFKNGLYAICKKTEFRPKDINRLKVKGWKNIFYVNSNQKRVGVVILISDKIVFKI